MSTSDKAMDKLITTVIDYHNRTKHRLDNYAKRPATIDWDDQPDPFRRFEACKKLKLKQPGSAVATLYNDLGNPAGNIDYPLTLDSIALLLELAFGLSAWKQFGPDRWCLRCNPSSGNLHPTEAYLIHCVETICQPGVYHYLSYDHSLEQRCQFSSNIKAQGVYIGLSSIHWREAWKYGERAFRYCQHDIGHALGALRYAAAALGWSVSVMDQCSDQTLEILMGLDRHDDFVKKEEESADILCRIDTALESDAIEIEDLVEEAKSAQWYGTAKSLKANHMYQWPIIEEVALASSKPETSKTEHFRAKQIRIHKEDTVCNTAEIIRQRRSAQNFDAATAMEKAGFFQILAALMPENRIPFEMWPWFPKIHLCLFIHRVIGLEPGLYVLPRSEKGKKILQEQTLKQFSWRKVEQAGSIPLFHLQKSDCRQITKTLSCHQPIASDGAFTLAMVAEFRETINQHPWHYRRLFWECGLIGQILYLEAEVAGMRGTGIGCYFDDSVHEVLGIKNDTLQSLYHFTIGKPVEDHRLQTLAAYAHLQRSK